MPAKIVIHAPIVVTLGIIALFLTFPAQHAQAASMTFSSDTTITTDQTIASGETWLIKSGVLVSIASGVTVQNNGTIWNEGTLVINGTLVSSQGALPDDYGIENRGSITNFGVLTSSGPFAMNDHGSSDLVFNNYDTFNISGSIGNAGVLNNYGTVNNSGTIMMDTLNNYGTINNDATLTMFGFTNSDSGTVNNNPDGKMDNQGYFTNEGRVNNYGSFTTEEGAYTENNDTIADKCDGSTTATGSYIGNPVSREQCDGAGDSSDPKLELVVPEFPIGALAGVVAAIGTLGGYYIHQKRSSH